MTCNIISAKQAGPKGPAYFNPDNINANRCFEGVEEDFAYFDSKQEIPD